MAGIVIVLDQWTKYVVRTDTSWQYVDVIPGWLGFHYTLNPGMAMGIDLVSTPIVSMISITAAFLIVGYVMYNIKTATTGYVVLMGLVIGGAFGNIIDRIFLGPVQGFEGFLQGHVVDFIHFYYQIGDTAVFPYIFNVADMAISVSLVTLIIFHKRFLPDDVKESEKDSKTEAEELVISETGLPLNDPFASSDATDLGTYSMEERHERSEGDDTAKQS
jgi:signal peptidase II